LRRSEDGSDEGDGTYLKGSAGGPACLTPIELNRVILGAYRECSREICTLRRKPDVQATLECFEIRRLNVALKLGSIIGTARVIALHNFDPERIKVISVPTSEKFERGTFTGHLLRKIAVLFIPIRTCVEPC